MPLVIGNDALGTDVYVVVLAEILGFLVWVFRAELFSWNLLVLFLFLLRGDVLLAV